MSLLIENNYFVRGKGYLYLVCVFYTYYFAKCNLRIDFYVQSEFFLIN